MRRIYLTLSSYVVVRVKADRVNLERQCCVHVVTQRICNVCDTKTLFLDEVNILDNTDAKLNRPFRGWNILTALKRTPLNSISFGKDSVRVSPEEGTSVASDCALRRAALYCISLASICLCASAWICSLSSSARWAANSNSLSASSSSRRFRSWSRFQYISVRQ